jgi:hypothetical protein
MGSGRAAPPARSAAVPTLGAALVAGVPDLSNAGFLGYLALFPETVAPVWRELTFSFIYFDPGLQLSATMTIAVILLLRGWPRWWLALGVGTAALGVGPLLYRIVVAFPAGHAHQAVLAYGWMVAGRGWNTWRRYPRVLDAEAGTTLFRALMRPAMQSMLAVGVAVALAIVAVFATGGHPDELPFDGLLAMPAIYFLSRAILVLPMPERWLARRLDPR